MSTPNRYQWWNNKYDAQKPVDSSISTHAAAVAASSFSSSSSSSALPPTSSNDGSESETDLLTQKASPEFFHINNYNTFEHSNRSQSASPGFRFFQCSNGNDHDDDNNNNDDATANGFITTGGIEDPKSFYDLRFAGEGEHEELFKGKQIEHEDEDLIEISEIEDEESELSSEDEDEDEGHVTKRFHKFARRFSDKKTGRRLILIDEISGCKRISDISKVVFGSSYNQQTATTTTTQQQQQQRSASDFVWLDIQCPNTFDLEQLRKHFFLDEDTIEAIQTSLGNCTSSNSSSYSIGSNKRSHFRPLSERWSVHGDYIHIVVNHPIKPTKKNKKKKKKNHQKRRFDMDDDDTTLEEGYHSRHGLLDASIAGRFHEERHRSLMAKAESRNAPLHIIISRHNLTITLHNVPLRVLQVTATRLESILNKTDTVASPPWSPAANSPEVSPQTSHKEVPVIVVTTPSAKDEVTTKKGEDTEQEDSERIQLQPQPQPRRTIQDIMRMPSRFFGSKKGIKTTRSSSSNKPNSGGLHRQYQWEAGHFANRPTSNSYKWLLFALLDTLIDLHEVQVDSLFFKVRLLDELIFELGDTVLRRYRQQRHWIDRLHRIRRRIIIVRRALWAKQKLLVFLTFSSSVSASASGSSNMMDPSISSHHHHHGSQLMPPEAKMYTRNLLHQVERCVDKLHVVQDLLTDSYANYLSQISMQLSNLSIDQLHFFKILSFIGTYVSPMTLVTGLWGMNIDIPGGHEDDLWWWIAITALVFIGFLLWYVVVTIFDSPLFAMLCLRIKLWLACCSISNKKQYKYQPLK